MNPIFTPNYLILLKNLSVFIQACFFYCIQILRPGLFIWSQCVHSSMYISFHLLLLTLLLCLNVIVFIWLIIVDLTYHYALLIIMNGQIDFSQLIIFDLTNHYASSIILFLYILDQVSYVDRSREGVDLPHITVCDLAGFWKSKLRSKQKLICRISYLMTYKS